jgi:DNA mismatch repair protein MutS
MFNEDAKIAAEVLGLTLTKRNHGGADPTPLAGFPHHALDRYANRLVKAGYKIAICEQTEDPKQAKGIVKRDIIEVITAGTATEDNFIDEKANNYIVCIVPQGDRFGIALCDLSTGEFSVEEIEATRLEEELVRIEPVELLLQEDAPAPLVETIRAICRTQILSRYDGWKFAPDNARDTLLNHFAIASLQALGLEGYESGIQAAGGLLCYLKEQKRNDLRHICTLTPRHLSEFAELDPSTIRNLELLKPMQTDDSGGTLLWALDKTGTAMGARLLKRWITHPLASQERIEERLDAVEWLKNDVFVRRETELFLRRIADIERLIGRITFERANARDLVALRQSLQLFPDMIKTLQQTPVRMLQDVRDRLTGFETLVENIATTLVDEPPLSIKDGGIIRAGYSAELDEIVDMAVHGKEWIARLQQQERERTGINTLKVGYNKVFGYYLEASNANLENIPPSYIRKQTLVNAERFVTPELKEMESRLLKAEEQRGSMEYEIFALLRQKIAAQCPLIQKAAEAVAILDVVVCFSRVAAEQVYCRPQLDSSTELYIKDGRHPVVEKMIRGEDFVPNDAALSGEESQLMLITGPNMAGKSTYLRQNALIAIMAQIGSFVPATSARIGIVDRFFTRVGASDRLARGQSTFLVEMIEVANILNNATDRSLVLLDEVGRGTSTFDGLSIAWAVAEYLHETAGRRARTFFATHYHELTELALLFPRIKNLHIKVKEWNDQIIFLRKIDEGSCDHSYGIQVARLAGVPRQVIVRAKEILGNLENMELTPDHKPVLARRAVEQSCSERDSRRRNEGVQLNLLDAWSVELIQQIQSLDLNTTTPIEALTILAELQRKAKNHG